MNKLMAHIEREFQASVTYMAMVSPWNKKKGKLGNNSVIFSGSLG